MYVFSYSFIYLLIRSYLTSIYLCDHLYAQSGHFISNLLLPVGIPCFKGALRSRAVLIQYSLDKGFVALFIMTSVMSVQTMNNLAV